MVGRSGDASGDTSGDGRWLSYEELAQLRGITKASAERLVLRNRWRRQRGNDRTVRILVPLDSMSGDMPASMSGDVSPDMSPDTKDLLAGALAALEAAVATLREQLERSEQRAQAAEQGRDGERRRADDAEADARELRAHATTLQLELAGQTETLQRLQALEEAADAARKAQGLLARLRAAWRGPGK